MNTYIQDKLDEFDKLKDKDGYNSDDGFDLGYDGFDISRIRYWVEQALTDYHNHIVEKIKNSDKAFGIIDKDGKGGAILITDIEKII